MKGKVLTKVLSSLIAIIIMISCLGSSYALTVIEPSISVKEAIDSTGKLMYKNTPDPNVGTFSGEWTILSLARGGIKVPQSYYNKYYDNVVKTLKDCDGVLHNVKYTEYSRVILGLTSIGKDPRNVGGYNLLEKLADFKKVIKQGINGPIFALIAFDTNNYEIPIVEGVQVQTTREMLIDYILGKEIDGGGWALSGKIPDPDITAMALQSLAPYKNDSKVKPYIDRALSVLSKLQDDRGGYSSWGTTNSESVDQVIVALCALGIDPAKDERFIKGNEWLISNLMRFYVSGGGFKHVENMDIDAMATDQGMYALVAYQRFLDNKNRLYDMTDANDSLNVGDNPNLDSGSNNDLDDNNENSDNDSNEDLDSDTNNDSNFNINQNSNEDGDDSNTTNINKIISNSGNRYSKSSSKSSSDKKIEATIIIKTIYEGEKDGLIPDNKKCIVAEFPKRDDKVAVVFNEKYKLFYSEELSKLSEHSTYIGLIDKDIKSEEVKNIEKYKFLKQNSERIIFGDINGDKVVNAQDVLNIQSILNGKLSRPNDKKIIAANVSMDSKIDNGDIDSIISKFINNKDYKILTIYKENTNKYSNNNKGKEKEEA